MLNRILFSIAIAVGVGLIFSACMPARYSAHNPNAAPANGTNAQTPASTAPPPPSELETQMKELAAQLVDKLAEAATQPLVAVLEFSTMDGKESEFGTMLAKELESELWNTQRVRLVERISLEKAEREVTANTTADYDPRHSVEIGKRVGAKVIATGTIGEAGDYFNIHAVLFETETSIQIGRGRVRVSRQALTQKTGRPDRPGRSGRSNGSTDTTTTSRSSRHSATPWASNAVDSDWTDEEWDDDIDAMTAPPNQFRRAPLHVLQGIGLAVQAGNFNFARELIRPDDRYLATDMALWNFVNVLATAESATPLHHVGDVASSVAYTAYGNIPLNFVQINGQWYLIFQY